MVTTKIFCIHLRSLYSFQDKELLCLVFPFVLDRQKNESIFEWLTSRPIKRKDLKFGLIFLKNNLKQKEQWPMQLQWLWSKTIHALLLFMEIVFRKALRKPNVSTYIFCSPEFRIFTQILKLRRELAWVMFLFFVTIPLLGIQSNVEIFYTKHHVHWNMGQL